MQKKQRHQIILDIISTNEIDTQEALTKKITEMGYNVSQATISRDIEELNLIKTTGNKLKFKYVKPNAKIDDVPKNIIELFKHVTVSIIEANNLIIIKTLSGNAGSAGMAIDHMHLKEILGTIAGDDTLLIITKNDVDAQIVLKILRDI